MIAIRGYGSAIAAALVDLLPPSERVVEVGRSDGFPLDADRYFFAAGYLAGKSLAEADAEDRRQSWRVNFVDVAEACDAIITGNPAARICVMGSESGISGSFDVLYAGAKAALHRYVETKRLSTPAQQLVCVAPSIVGDAGMTLRRRDAANLARREKDNPKRRFIEAVEVARLVKYLLYDDLGYVTGTVIRMHGGPA